MLATAAMLHLFLQLKRDGGRRRKGVGTEEEEGWNGREGKRGRAAERELEGEVRKEKEGEGRGEIA